MKTIPSSIVAPRGFLASGVFCDVKRQGTGKGSDKGRKRDLALIVSEVPATVAGMFTTNQVSAAPVKVCLPRVARGTVQAVVVNSGNANACTGRQGLADAREMTSLVARAFHLPRSHVLVASTGRIGLPLPMESIREGIPRAAGLLGQDARHADEAAEAIMTSDTRMKQVAVEFRLAGKRARLGGICKGAGMIQPGMSPDAKRPASMPKHATMLGFLTTDADVAPRVLRPALREAVAGSFNRITVDGDMSTNDTVLLLANGLAENAAITKTRTGGRIDPGFSRFREALNYACLELAKMIVRDGEGVHRMVTVRVGGARSAADADAAARAVVNSTLVKTSWHGGDPNWGRIMNALGYSGARVVENRVDIGYSTPAARRVVWSLKQGQPTSTTFTRLCSVVEPDEFDLHINLNLGKARATVYAADLTEAYVDFNKGDVSDPSSLGG